MRKYKTIRGLFANIERWVKNAMAATEKSEYSNFAIYVCPLKSPEATCVCLEGAVRLVYPANERAEVRRKLRVAIKAIEGYSVSIIDWNDKPHRTYSEVKAVVRRAGV